MVRKRKKQKSAKGKGEPSRTPRFERPSAAADDAASSDEDEQDAAADGDDDAPDGDAFGREGDEADDGDESTGGEGEAEDEEPSDTDEAPGEEGDELSSRAARSSDDEGPQAAVQLGSARFVIFGFFAGWLVSAYIAHKALEGIWGSLGHREWFMRALPALATVPHEGELISRGSITLVLGALLAGVIIYLYYRKPDVRQWADEVAEQVSKVKWPTRKETGNNTIVVIAVGAVLAAYLAILDRFWGFLTNLFYTSGL